MIPNPIRRSASPNPPQQQSQYIYATPTPQQQPSNYTMNPTPNVSAGPDGKPLFLCQPFVRAALVTGKFKSIVVLPKYVDINEWVAINSEYPRSFLIGLTLWAGPSGGDLGLDWTGRD
jgi:MOB kinase activator 1